MGCYKIGSECCNNCVHWDCHSERKFIGNPPTEVYTSSNSDKCMLTGRNVLSKNTCGMFKHIGGITKTFAAELKHSEGDYTKNMLDGMDELSRIYLGGIIDSVRSNVVERKAAVQQVVPEKVRDDDVDEIDVKELKEAMSGLAELGRANERVNELKRAGMDVRYQLKDKSVEFMHLLDRANDGSAADQYRLAQAFKHGTHGAIKEGSMDMGDEYFRVSLWQRYSPMYLWCKKAAEQGYARAEYWLGTLERDGKNWGHNDGADPAKDLVAAIKWFGRAAEHGYDGARRALELTRSQAFGDAVSRLLDALKYLSGIGCEKKC